MHTLYWEDSRLFWDNGTVYGVYCLPKLPYEHQSDGMKRSILRQLEVLFLTYHGKGQLLSLTRPVPAEQIAADQRQYSTHPSWEAHIEAVQERIESHATFERHNYLIVPITSSHGIEWETVLDRPDLFRERMTDQTKRFVGFMKRKVMHGKGIPIVTSVDLEAAKKANIRMLNRLQAMIPGIRQATPHDIEFAHRSPYFRGLGQMPIILSDPLPRTISITGEGVMIRPRPLKLSLTSCDVLEDTFRVRVVHDNGQCSYQSVMAAATMPESTNILGDEWLYQPLEHLDFPIDACVHFEIVPPKRARDMVFRRKKIVSGQEEEFSAVGDVPWDVYDGLDDAQSLEAKTKAGMTLVMFHAFFAVGATTELEMLRRESKLKEKLEGIIHLVHPPGDAIRLWQAFFPASTNGVEPRWMIPSDPTLLSSSGLLGTMQVGDPSGMWLGYLRHNKAPVYADWFRPMRELNRSGAVAFVGNPGSGKSNAMKYACDAMMMWGALGVIVDPKQGEYYALVELWKEEAVWWQFGPGSKLKFSPFRLGKDAAESRQIAEGFLSVLLNISSRRDDQIASLVIRRALTRLYQGTLWDMDHFLEALMQEVTIAKNPNDRELAERFHELLDNYRDDATGQAIFGQDGEDAMDSRARLTVVSTMGLDFPAANIQPEDWRESQRFSVAILYLIAQLGFRRLAAAPRNIPKFFGLDEFWLLRAIPEGRALINAMILLGRSMYLVLLLAVQNPDVLLPKDGEQNDDLAASLGWIFVGRIISETQVKYAVRLLGLPDNVDYSEKFQEFEKGRGFLRDPLGRIGEIQIDVQPEELLDAFDTTPA